jgi:uncharacterized protein (TIGR02996 family)
MTLDSRAEPLLHAIAASPDDDGPRLVFADHIADRWPAHAAWIVAELGGKATPELEQAFLDELPPPLRTRETVFWRGFVDTEEWQLDASDFLALDPDELFRLAPACRRIRLDKPKDLPALGARMRRFDHLNLRTLELDAAGAHALASATDLAHLRALTLSEAHIDDEATAALFRDACFHDLERFGLRLFTSAPPAWSSICAIANAPFAPSLRALELAAGKADYRDLVELVPELPALVELRSSGNTIDTRIAHIPRRLDGLALGLSRTGDDVADALAASSVLADATMFSSLSTRWTADGTVRWLRSRSYGPLRELRHGFCESPTVVDALVESELPRSVERLTLFTMFTPDAVARFADCAWPRLRELVLEPVEEENVATLAAAPWMRHLDRLALRDSIDEPAARLLVERLGPRTRLEIDGYMERWIFELLRARFGRRLTVLK